MTRAVIFDLDGTLADTSRDLVAAANASFAALGLPEPLNAEREGPQAMLGGGRAMLALGHARLGTTPDEAGIKQQYQDLIEQYAKSVCVHSRLYPGCKAALSRLTARGVKTGLCTNKPERLVGPLLAGLGIAGHFTAVVAADTLAVRKPDPAPLAEVARRLGADVKQSVLVGDSGTDAETARRAGAGLILVGFGPLGAAVSDLDPDAILSQFDDLDAILHGLWDGGEP